MGLSLNFRCGVEFLRACLGACKGGALQAPFYFTINILTLGGTLYVPPECVKKKSEVPLECKLGVRKIPQQGAYTPLAVLWLGPLHLLSPWPLWLLRLGLCSLLAPS